MGGHVVIAVPHTGELRAELVEYLIRVRDRSAPGPVVIFLRHGKPIESVRNEIVRDFLSTDAAWLLFIDSDNPPASGRDPLEVLDQDLDIVGFPTPIWRGERVKVGAWPLEFSAYDESEDGNWCEHRGDPRGVIEEVDAVGTGCMLIARRVLEHESMRAPFAREFDAFGVSSRGSDLLFCQRARKAGFHVFADYSRPCSHVKPIDYLEVNQALGARDISHALRPNPNTEKYWDTEWADRPARHLPFYDEIVRAVGGKWVLDYGCGRGDLLALLGEHAVGFEQSQVARDICRKRGLKVVTPDSSGEDRLVFRRPWDAVVCTEVLEHIDDDQEMLREFFDWADEVWYSVPNNCLPPGMEPEHRRVYTREYIERITPYLQSIKEVGIWFLVHAKK